MSRQILAPEVKVAGRGGRQDSADFAGMFAALLEAAQLTADKLLRELEKQGQPTVVSRATVYDWAKGQHLPAEGV